jgi:hypothetical protein
MKLLTSVRSRFSGQTQEAFGQGERFPVSKTIVKEVRRHLARFEKVDMSAYTFERRRSDYADAKSDLVIYDENGAPVVRGREFDNGHLSFWDR